MPFASLAGPSSGLESTRMLACPQSSIVPDRVSRIHAAEEDRIQLADECSPNKVGLSIRLQKSTIC